MLQNGSVVHAQTTPLIVRKAGLGADVYFFAHDYAALYGVIAVLLAVSAGVIAAFVRSEEHTSELQSIMRSSYAVFCLKKKNRHILMYQHKNHRMTQQTNITNRNH